jgi:hypothetical protein
MLRSTTWSEWRAGDSAKGQAGARWPGGVLAGRPATVFSAISHYSERGPGADHHILTSGRSEQATEAASGADLRARRRPLGRCRLRIRDIDRGGRRRVCDSGHDGSRDGHLRPSPVQSRPVAQSRGPRRARASRDRRRSRGCLLRRRLTRPRLAAGGRAPPRRTRTGRSPSAAPLRLSASPPKP